MRNLTVAFAALLAGTALSISEGAFAQERTVKITGFGAKSGVVRVFGVNSEAALKAAAEEINKAGGVTLGDGTKAKFTIEFLDDRCNAEEGISVVRRIASTDAFVAVGPTCSNVAESLFGILQKKIGDVQWSISEAAILTVAKPGGLKPGLTRSRRRQQKEDDRRGEPAHAARHRSSSRAETSRGRTLQTVCA